MAAANSNAEQFKLDNYLPMHRNLKLWYRTKKIKKAYLFLLNNEPIDLAHDYASLFYEDLLIAMTKMLKELSNHQQNTLEALLSYETKGRQVLVKLYSSYMMEGNQILGDKRNHKVNPKKKTRISHFYTIVIGYLLQLACSYRKKDTHNDAHKVYQAGYAIVYNLAHSSTSNYQLSKKITQFLLSYGSHLQCLHKPTQAAAALELSLRNQANILSVLSSRFKVRNLRKGKKMKEKSLCRLFAIFSNLSLVYLTLLCYHKLCLCLLECQFISKIMESSASRKKSNEDYYLPFRKEFIAYNQVKTICEAYFDRNILSNIKPITHKTSQALKTEHEFRQTVKSIPPQYAASLKTSIVIVNQAMRQKKRAMTLLSAKKDQLNTEILLLGTDTGATSSNQHPKQANFGRKLDSKWRKRKTKFNDYRRQMKHEKELTRHQFNQNSQPMQLQHFQKNITELLEEQIRCSKQQRGKCQLLRTKSTCQVRKHLESTDHEEELKAFVPQRSEKSIFLRSCGNEEKLTVSGLNLFRKIILKHARTFNLKKSETIILLQQNPVKEDVPPPVMLDSFLTPISPNESIKFLMQHDRQFLRNTKEEKEESSDNGIKGRFKLREDSEIPTLFLSYYKSID